MNSRKIIIVTALLLIAFLPENIWGQEELEIPQDSLKSVVNAPHNEIGQDSLNDSIDELNKVGKSTSKSISDTQDNQIKRDTTNTEVSPLDIPHNRGVFIMADKGNLQLRIMGSIRFSALFDNKLLTDKSRFNTYDIPTGDADFSVINYYNSLMFSR